MGWLAILLLVADLAQLAIKIWKIIQEMRKTRPTLAALFAARLAAAAAKRDRGALEALEKEVVAAAG